MYEIFHIADEVGSGKYSGFLAGKSVILFFPASSIRTRVTRQIMDLGNKGALLNPCPPFYRGVEVSEDAIQSEYFVGYEFKKNLLVVRQAVMIWCMLNAEAG